MNVVNIGTRPASVFPANYWGTCEFCDERIEPGMEVTWEDDVLVHVECSGEL